MTVEHVAGDDSLRVVRLSGELDLLTVAPLLERVPELVREARAVVLDLTEVTFFDSSGVRLTDAFARSCAGGGVRFRVVAPPGGRSRRVLELVDMADGMVEDDLDAALSALRRS